MSSYPFLFFFFSGKVQWPRGESICKSVNHLRVEQQLGSSSSQADVTTLQRQLGKIINVKEYSKDSMELFKFHFGTIHHLPH
jgi:hypothetical protein